MTDPEWKNSFLKKAYASQRQIVPVFVEGRLSKFFYRVYRVRKALGVKFNIEMLWLPDEMFSQKGRHFRIVVGDPIPVAELQRFGSLHEQALEVRKKAYFLEKRSPARIKTANFGIFALSCNRKRIQYPSSNRSPGNCCSQN